MKFLLLAFFSLSVLNLAFAAEDKITCFKPLHPYSLKYSSIKVLTMNNLVSKIKIILADSVSAINDQNPSVSDLRLPPICHGTLSGRYLCTPWTTVKEYTRFEKNLITSFYLQSETTAVIALPGESEAFKAKEVSCF